MKSEWKEFDVTTHEDGGIVRKHRVSIPKFVDEKEWELIQELARNLPEEPQNPG